MLHSISLICCISLFIYFKILYDYLNISFFDTLVVQECIFLLPHIYEFFHLPKFFKTCFMVWLVYCFLCTWKECVFCCHLMEYSVSVCEVHWVYTVVQVCCLLIDLCLDDLSIAESGVLKSPSIIVLLSISLFSSLNMF